ncbi:Zinc finger protein 39, partial [Stegodyphus mimosarum]
MKMVGKIQNCKDFSLCRHEKNFISLKRSNCDVCNEQFLDRELLANHILTHIGAPPYCSICKAVFITPWQLHNHLLIDHKVSSKIELLSGNPQCDDCMLYHGPELAFHYAHHIKQMSYNCEICNLSFCNEKDIIIHSHLHKPDGEMNCEVCGKTFQEKLKCLLHVVTHNNHVLFQHFPNCALEFSNSLSFIRNTENILNSSDDNLLGIDSECQDHLLSLEWFDEQCLDNSSQFGGHHNEDVEQFQKTGLCDMENFDKNSKNQRFPSVGNFTWRQSKVSVKEVWVILHKLPDCIYNTYSCNNYIYIDNLKFVKTSNCYTSDTISGKSCCAVRDFPHVCGSEKDVLSTLNQEEDISDQNLNMEEYSVFSTDFDLSDSPDSVLADLLSEESSIFLKPYSDEMFPDYGFKITKAVKVKVYIPKSLWSCDQKKNFSSLLKEYDLYVLNNGLKFVSLHICETAKPNTKLHKLVCIKGKTGLRFLIPDCSKKPCVKLHRLCDNILNLYMNNHPIIFKKDVVVQETLNNTDQLGDCSGVVEFNLDSHARVIDNNYLKSNNFVIEDDHENYKSVQSCESNTNILSHCDQVKLRDVSVKLHKLSDDILTFHCKSVLAAEGENDNFINLCEKNNDRGDHQKSEDKEKIKSSIKKSEKKKNTVCKGISNKPQKKKVCKKLLHKKCTLLEKYMKSFLFSRCMKNFLLNFKYAELADTVKILKNRRKKTRSNEEFVSFVRRLINSANRSKKKVSRFIPEKNFQSSIPKKDEIMCFSPEFKSFNVQGVQEMMENPCTSKTISTGNPSDSSGIQNEIIDVSEVHKINNSFDHCSEGCPTNMEEIQNNDAKKNVENMLEAKKVLDDSVHIRSETGDLEDHTKECITNISNLKKVSECRAMINIVRAALKRRQNKFQKKNYQEKKKN